jgi:hypothetical protein
MNKKYNIFLDDIRVPSDVTWVSVPKKDYLIVRNYDLFVKTIKHKGIPDFISFDHDLADQHYGDGLKNDNIKYDKYTEKTGYDCAKWLVNYCGENNLNLPEYMVHSLNPVGAKNILMYLNSYSLMRNGK